MKVILLSTTAYGKAGDIVSVKPGFGRYLIQRRDALFATNENLQQFKDKQEDLLKASKEAVEIARSVYTHLKDQVLTFIRNASEDGRLFGSVSKKDIVKSILELLSKSSKNYKLEPRHIALSEPVKEIGIFLVSLNIHPELESQSIKINVALSKEYAKIALDKHLSEQKSTGPTEKKPAEEPINANKEIKS